MEDIIEFLRNKKLINGDNTTFKILHDEGGEFVLNDLLKEFSDSKKEDYLRLLAEFENYKKRVNKEKELIKEDTKVNILKSILDIDNELDIAINSVTEEHKNSISIIISKIKKLLEKQNITEINCEYDENIHEVISVIPNDELKIISIISKGYMLGDKIIRYPKIILGKPNE